jgi:hypothetical protein
MLNENEPICPQEDCVPSEELPSLMQMAKNLVSDGTKIVKNAVQGNSTLVDEGVKQYRWSVCQECPQLQNDRCLECGCFMKVKVAFVTSNCPLGKW